MRIMIKNEGKQYVEQLRQEQAERNKKGPVYYLTPVEERAFWLYEWEMEGYKESAKMLGLKIGFNPVRAIYDELGKTWMVLSWSLDSDKCPFVDDKFRCRVYQERSLVCHSFPVNVKLFAQLAGGSRQIDDPLGIRCPVVPREKFNKSLKAFAEEYGDAFRAAYESYVTELTFMRAINSQIARFPMRVKVHSGPIPQDRKNVQPAIAYLTGLGVLPKGFEKDLVKFASSEAERLIKQLKAGEPYQILR